MSIHPELLAKRLALSMIEQQSILGSKLCLTEDQRTQESTGSDKRTVPVHTRSILPTQYLTNSIVRKGEARTGSQEEFRWRLRMPFWVTAKALEFACLKAPDGWQINLRSYRRVSLDDEIVQFAGSGNIEGLQKLFTSGKASPFDRVEINGRSLLYVCPSRTLRT
jgi:hypothetical protein